MSFSLNKKKTASPINKIVVKGEDQTLEGVTLDDAVKRVHGMKVSRGNAIWKT